MADGTQEDLQWAGELPRGGTLHFTQLQWLSLSFRLQNTSSCCHALSPLSLLYSSSIHPGVVAS